MTASRMGRSCTSCHETVLTPFNSSRSRLCQVGFLASSQNKNVNVVLVVSGHHLFPCQHSAMGTRAQLTGRRLTSSRKDEIPNFERRLPVRELGLARLRLDGQNLGQKIATSRRASILFDIGAERPFAILSKSLHGTHKVLDRFQWDATNKCRNPRVVPLQIAQNEIHVHVGKELRCFARLESTKRLTEKEFAWGLPGRQSQLKDHVGSFLLHVSQISHSPTMSKAVNLNRFRKSTG